MAKRCFVLFRTGSPHKEWETMTIPLPKDKAIAFFKNRKGMYHEGDLIVVEEIDDEGS
jgi:hypothetical protein